MSYVCIKAWESRAPYVPTRFLGRTDWKVTALGFIDAADRCSVFAGCGDGAIYGWDWLTGDQVMHFPASPDFVPGASNESRVEVKHICGLQMRDGRQWICVCIDKLQLLAIDVATGTVVGRFKIPTSEEAIRAIYPYESDGHQGVLLVSDISKVRWLGAPDLRILDDFGEMTAEWLHGLSLARHRDQPVLVTWHERYGLETREEFVALRVWDLATMRVLWSCAGMDDEFGLYEASVHMTPDSFFVIGDRVDTECAMTPWFYRPNAGNGVRVQVTGFRGVVTVSPAACNGVYDIVVKTGLGDLACFAFDPGASIDQAVGPQVDGYPDFDGCLVLSKFATVGQRGALLTDRSRIFTTEASAISSACDATRRRSSGKAISPQWDDRFGPINQIAANESFVIAGANGDLRILSALDGSFVRRARTRASSFALFSGGESCSRAAQSWFVGLGDRQLTVAACASDAQYEFELETSERAVPKVVTVCSGGPTEFAFVAEVDEDTGHVTVVAYPIRWQSRGPVLQASAWRWRDGESDARWPDEGVVRDDGGDAWRYDVSLLAWHEQGEIFLAVGTLDTRIVVVKASTAEVVGVYRDPAPAGLLRQMCLVNTLEGTHVAYLTDRGSLGLWNPKAGAAVLRTQEVDRKDLYMGLAAFGALSDPRIVTTSMNGTIRTRDLSLETTSLIALPQNVHQVAQAGPTKFAVCVNDGVIFFRADV